MKHPIEKRVSDVHFNISQIYREGRAAGRRGQRTMETAIKMSTGRWLAVGISRADGGAGGIQAGV